MHIRVLGAAAALVLASATPSLALDNSPGSVDCSCACQTATGTHWVIYRDMDYGCAVLDNRACNVENPRTGLIETGRTEACTLATGPSDSLDGAFDSGPSSPGRPGLTGPLPGVLTR